MKSLTLEYLECVCVREAWKILKVEVWMLIYSSTGLSSAFSAAQMFITCVVFLWPWEAEDRSGRCFARLDFCSLSPWGRWFEVATLWHKEPESRGISRYFSTDVTKDPKMSLLETARSARLMLRKGNQTTELYFNGQLCGDAAVPHLKFPHSLRIGKALRPSKHLKNPQRLSIGLSIGLFAILAFRSHDQSLSVGVFALSQNVQIKGSAGAMCRCKDIVFRDVVCVLLILRPRCQGWDGLKFGSSENRISACENVGGGSRKKDVRMTWNDHFGPKTLGESHNNCLPGRCRCRGSRPCRRGCCSGSLEFSYS